MASSSGSGGNEVFDVRRIRRFVELMNEHELTEIDLRQGEQRIRLRRGPETIAVSSPAGVTQVAAAPATPTAPADSGTAETSAAPPSTADDQSKYVESPMVGTFYASATPDSPPFVKVGDQIGPDSTVCIVEAMKVFNEIPAGCSGKIAAVLVENGDAVEFGQKLFQIQ